MHPQYHTVSYMYFALYYINNLHINIRDTTVLLLTKPTTTTYISSTMSSRRRGRPHESNTLNTANGAVRVCCMWRVHPPTEEGDDVVAA